MRKVKSIYLAHPHRSADFVKAVLQPIIEGWGFKVYNAFEGRGPNEWYEGNSSKQIAEEIVRADIEKIIKSDIVVVYAPYESTGKSMETLLAFQQGKPIVVWDNISVPSNPWFVAHATWIVRSLEWLKAVLEQIKEVGSPPSPSQAITQTKETEEIPTP